MISTKIEDLIKDAMKSKNEVATKVLRLIKTEFMKIEKEKGFGGWDDNKEEKVLLKMASQRKDAIAQFLDGDRADLAEAEKKELDYLEQFIPKQPTEEDIKSYVQSVIDDMKAAGKAITMASTGVVLAKVREKYSSADGKIVSGVVKANM